MYSDFFSFLKNRLKEPLPGFSAQMKMAPRPASEKGSARQAEPPAEARPSSVLILLFPDKTGHLKLLLTQRTHHIDHGGELSLPGGRAELGETTAETALRETWEEVGIRSDEIEIAGRLSDLYVSHSLNNVSPVVGFLNRKPEVTINPEEVEEAFFISLNALLDKEKLVVEEWDLHGTPFKVPYWSVHKVPLWGATAMILSELVDLYRELLPD